MSEAHMALRDFPDEEKPRERLLHSGPAQLSHAELLAILLRTGTRDQSVLVLAQRLLNQAGGLRELANLDIEQMTEIKGIGHTKAMQVIAALELGKRISRSNLDLSQGIRSPHDAVAYLREEMRYLAKEVFICLLLNTKNQIVGREVISIGTLNASLVHPREVFQAAIRKNCAAIICAHNHPSGDPQPSPEDIAITQRLVEAGTIIGIEVLDHVVIGDTNFVSLKEQGYM